MKATWTGIGLAVALVFSSVFVLGRSSPQAKELKQEVPQAKGTEAKARPAKPELKVGESPKLKGLARAALKGKVDEFVDWAGNTPPDKKKDVREKIAEVKDDEGVADSLCEVVQGNSKKDHGKTVVALALLGEMRNPRGKSCLRGFVDQKLPKDGTVVDGDILERVVLEQQMMKAVDGLAFMEDSEAQDAVLDIAANHESRAVRAEAIGAYLENHGNSEEAKKALRGKIKSEDGIFLDRLVVDPEESAEDFDRRLADYLKAHPELKPKNPEKGKAAEATDESDKPLAPPAL